MRAQKTWDLIFPYSRIRAKHVEVAALSSSRRSTAFVQPSFCIGCATQKLLIRFFTDSATKAGVLGLGKAMARELGPDGIRVNSITPGLIQTDITGDKLTDDLKAEIIKGIPLSRLGVAVDIANACLFLASDLSSYITGATIDVNGGMLIH